MYNTTTFICLRSAIIHDTKMSEPEALLYAYLLNSVIGTLMLFEINDDNDDKATFVILTHFSFLPMEEELIRVSYFKQVCNYLSRSGSAHHLLI